MSQYGIFQVGLEHDSDGNRQILPAAVVTVIAYIFSLSNVC